MIWPEIEPRSPRPLVNILIIMPIRWYKYKITLKPMNIFLFLASVKYKLIYIYLNHWKNNPNSLIIWIMVFLLRFSSSQLFCIEYENLKMYL